MYVTDSSETDSETEEYEVRRPQSYLAKKHQKLKYRQAQIAEREAEQLRKEREYSR